MTERPRRINAGGADGPRPIQVRGGLDSTGLATLAAAVRDQVTAGAREIVIELDHDHSVKPWGRHVEDLRVHCALHGVAVHVTRRPAGHRSSIRP